MRFSLKSAFIAIVLCLYAIPASAASFEYLYVEASEGNSSGGHSAIQFGDEIYHFQHHDSGLIRLLRQDKQEFHFLYRFLQNRRIHLSHIKVSEETFNMLRAYFKLQFLAQDQQFKQLDDLHKDRVILQRLLNSADNDDAALDTDFSSVLQLKGVGLFYAKQELDKHIKNVNRKPYQTSHPIEMLRKKIEQQYGADFLLRQREQITTRIKALKPSHWPDIKRLLSKANFPPAINSFADSYGDYLTGLAAIKVLEEAHPLQSDAFFITHEPVTPAEKEALVKLRDHLTLSLVKSVDSGRPDWGYAVLVNMARFIAIEQSLQLGLWVFIDDFAIDSEWVSADQFAHYTGQMQAQINDARGNLLQTRKTLLNSEGLTEANYSALEMSANRYFELRKGQQQKAIRYIGETALPTKSISLPDWLIPELPPQQIKAALNELDSYESKLRQELAQHYQYGLITRNCVTELFRTIDQALLQQIQTGTQSEQLIKESTKRLGGNLSATYNFIPFASFQSVQDHYNVTTSQLFNSHRDQQLEKLYVESNTLINVLRESNTLTSTLYAYNPDDAFFVFFTDDNLMFRPIFGLFNTAAGIGQSLFGLLSWPFDAGRNLKSGATGVLMSLPEIVFFNIRKGSYKYLSYHQFMNDKKSRH